MSMIPHLIGKPCACGKRIIQEENPQLTSLITKPSYKEPMGLGLTLLTKRELIRCDVCQHTEWAKSHHRVIFENK